MRYLQMSKVSDEGYNLRYLLISNTMTGDMT